MADENNQDFWADPKRTAKLALGMGALGGPLIAIGIALESVFVLVVGIIALVVSGVIWTIRGIKEDQ